jgi:hypothetical protein
MDPISVISSINGILAAAGKIAEVLSPIASAALNDTAATTANAVFSEINNAITVLSAAQTLFNNPEFIPQERKALIQVNQLITTLTDGVLIFSELEELVLPLGKPRESFRKRILWARKERALASLLSRMQSFKVSISVILNIIQW